MGTRQLLLIRKDILTMAVHHISSLFLEVQSSYDELTRVSFTDLTLLVYGRSYILTILA